MLQTGNTLSSDIADIFLRAKTMARTIGGVPPRPRERIISTARDLFRKHGIRGIGVDAIAEAAGTNKMTLYRHFGSKDDLDRRVLARRRQRGRRDLEQLRARLSRRSAGTALVPGFASVPSAFVDDGRGCDIANVAVELAESDHPARHVIEEFKRDQRDRLAKLCPRSRNCESRFARRHLVALLEGARVSRQSAGIEGPSARSSQSAKR